MTNLSNAQRKALAQIVKLGFQLGAPMHATYVALEKKGLVTAPDAKGNRQATEAGKAAV